jgi:hypothetical protein
MAANGDARVGLRCTAGLLLSPGQVRLGPGLREWAMLGLGSRRHAGAGRAGRNEGELGYAWKRKEKGEVGHDRFCP